MFSGSSLPSAHISIVGVLMFMYDSQLAQATVSCQCFERVFVAN